MPLPVVAPFLIVGATLLRKPRPLSHRKGERPSKSHKEDQPPTRHTPRSKVAKKLREALGIRYSYGAGSPRSGWAKPVKGIKGGLGLDCSGFAQTAQVELGNLSEDAPDRGASGLAKVCKIIPWGKQRAGDLAFYGRPISHVMVVMEDAGTDGDSPVIGASGGRSHTNGDDPKACIKEFSSAKYRKDFNCFGRL